MKAIDELTQASLYLITNTSKDGENSLFVPFRFRRVFKAPVKALGLSRKQKGLFDLV